MAKSKTKKKSHKPSKKYKFYNAEGKKSRKECPKCGKAIFMGHHKNPERYVCGKCGLVEKASK